MSDLSGYLAACESPTQIAIEEPETHLHPKVQTRLANWLVSLAMSGYHWDVYLSPARKQVHGLDQLNITHFGAPASEGAAGDLHHLPKDKASRLKKSSGWSC